MCTFVALLLQLFQPSPCRELNEPLEVWGSLVSNFQLYHDVVIGPGLDLVEVPKAIPTGSPWVVDGETPVLNRSDLPGHFPKNNELFWAGVILTPAQACARKKSPIFPNALYHLYADGTPENHLDGKERSGPAALRFIGFKFKTHTLTYFKS